MEETESPAMQELHAAFRRVKEAEDRYAEAQRLFRSMDKEDGEDEPRPD